MSSSTVPGLRPPAEGTPPPIDPAPSPAGDDGGSGKRWLFAGVAAAVLAIAGFAFALTSGGGGGDDGNVTAGGADDTETDAGTTEDDAGDDGAVDPDPTATPVPEATATPEPIPTPTAGPTATPVPIPTPTPDPDLLPCPADASRCIEVTDIMLDGDSLVVTWNALGFTPARSGGFHAHFFWNDQAPESAGNNAANFGAPVGDWAAVDAQPYSSATQGQGLSAKPAAADKFCVTVANSSHGLDDPSLFQCLDIPGS